MTTHENLPALNKYTSAAQYEALKEINETNSIVKIVQSGRSSKTLGALIRSMWIKQKDYTDEGGVLREGWFVTDNGHHAMNIYKVKYDREQEQVRKQAELVDKFEGTLAKFVEVEAATTPKIVALHEELAKLEQELGDAKREVMRWAPLIPVHDQNSRDYF